MNRVELHTMGTGNDVVRVFDFCEDNLDHSLDELDNPLLEDILIISPGTFNSRSLERGEQATYGFHFISLPEIQCTSATIMAVAYDVFGNSVRTQLVTENRCPPPPPSGGQCDFAFFVSIDNLAL